VGSGIPKSNPEAKILVNRAQAVPKDSPFFCLKMMISYRRSLICVSEKKVGQNFFPQNCPFAFYASDLKVVPLLRFSR
jgi:hypothetical protein